MARAKATDFLHSFRFHVVVNGFGATGTTAVLQTGTDRPQAGFNQCSTPEASEEAVEYREGHYIYTQKYVGLPSLSDVTLQRGVAMTDGSFWQWMKRCIEGNEEYRADVDIRHMHRDAKPQTQSSPSVAMSPMAIPANGAPGVITYHLHEAFPTRHKVAGDLDSTASEVSIQELDLAYEWFDIENPLQVTSP
jgi:phage tail-like protein